MHSLPKRLIQTTLAAALGFSFTIAAQADILVGLESPITGAYAHAGQDEQHGVEVAVELYNKNTQGEKIKLITIDDESEPAKAIAAVEKLGSEKVVAIISGYGSNLTGPASKAADKLGIPLVTAGATSNNLAKQGLKSFFQILNNDGYKKALTGIYKKLGPKTVSILYSTKESTSNLAEEMKKELEGSGITLKMHAFDPSTSDYKPLLNKIKLQDKPDLLQMMAYENDYIAILKAGKILKPKVDGVMAIWSLLTPDMLKEHGDLMQGVFGTATLGVPATFTTDDGKAFYKQFNDQFKKNPGYIDVYGYVGAKVLLGAIARAEAAGKVTSATITEQLRKTNEETLLGPVKFDDTGFNTEFVQRIAQVQGDRIEIVWPDNAATAKPLYPKTPW